jgi:lipopolysaccharide/colanic/teichoic acid biosynthesis glycosyltransferase
MRRSERLALILGLIGLDALAVALGVLAANRWIAIQKGLPTGSSSLPLLLAATVSAGVVFFAANRLYRLDELLEGPVEYGRIVYGCTLTAFGLSVVGFWGKDLGDALTPSSRRFIALFWLFSVVAAGAGRFAARRVVRALRRRGRLVSRALIVGVGPNGISVARHFHDLPGAGVHVVGFIDDFLPPGTPVTGGLQVLGPPSALPRLLQETTATEVIVLPMAMAWESFQELVRTASNLNGYAIRLAPGVRDIVATNVRVHQFGAMPLLTVERVRITGLDAIIKRATDLGVVLLMAPFALPLVAMAAVALARRGLPPFCVLRLTGQGGVPFSSAVLGASDPSDPVQRVICGLRIDRLPQLLNVLRGQMSIVGPRPVAYEDRDRYERWLPNLVTVKPGITAPCTAPADGDSFEEHMQTNLFYIRNYTVWRDLEIMLRAFLRLATGQTMTALPAPPAARRAAMTVEGEGH